MRQKAFIGIATAISLVIGGIAAGAETLESAEKAITEAWSKHRTLQYKSTFRQQLVAEEGREQSDGEMTTFLVRTDKGWRSRMDSAVKSVRQPKDAKAETYTVKTTVVYDGEMMYSLTDYGDEKLAAKMRLSPEMDTNPFDAAALFKQLHEEFELKLLPDAKLDGADTYVIEMKPKEPGPDDLAVRTVNWYDKKTGVGIKQVSYNADNEPVLTSLVTEVKINEPIKPETFVFKAPAGVEVKDMTQVATQPSRAGGTRPATGPAAP